MGTRLKEETEFKPKPLVEVGNRPILWHIMKIYSYYGHKDFILALGYKGNMIKEYFMQSRWIGSDFTLNTKKQEITYHDKVEEDWNITFAETGYSSLTGKRLYLVKKYLEGEDNFMFTYGDGVSNINIEELVRFHKKMGKIVTMTGINPASQFGIIHCDANNIVKEFKEKPISNDIVNGGFMVMNKKIFDYINPDEDKMLVNKTIPDLAKIGQVVIYHHNDFWYCMDTYRDFLHLNDLWKKDPKWKVW